VTLGDTIVKQNARKIRRVYNDRILVALRATPIPSPSFRAWSRSLSSFTEPEPSQWNWPRSGAPIGLRHLEAFLLATDGM